MCHMLTAVNTTERMEGKNAQEDEQESPYIGEQDEEDDDA